MPVDGRYQATTTKPVTPALSANLRSRPAVIPRLAGSAPTSPALGLQRNLRTQALSPERSEDDRTQNTAVYGNITPRSGVRNSRIGTESPNASSSSLPRRDPTVREGTPSTFSPGLGISTPPNVSSYRRTSGSSAVSQVKDENKFFHVNDVKPAQQITASKPTALRPRQAQYTAPYVRAVSPKTSPKKTSTGSDVADKFFRANDLHNPAAQKIARPALYTKLSSASLASTKSKASASSAQMKSPTAAHLVDMTPVTDKPRSPSNTTSNISPSDRRRSSSFNITPLAFKSQPPSQTDHRKSMSASSVTIGPKTIDYDAPIPAESPQVQPIPLQFTTAASHSPASLSPRSTSLASANTVATTTTIDTEYSEPLPPKPATAPPGGGHKRSRSEFQVTPITPAQLEAASNARRERKVLDLEISNSSLLAINKSLERELRKQTTELRRFRRLSRSGRLSLTAGNRAVSGQSMISLDTLAEGDDDDAPSSDDEEHSNSASEPEDEDSFLSEETGSMASTSDRIRQRARDEKRLMQDLSRHQQILIDSQKLSQSIHRCMSQTDTLIKEGTKALAYRVGIGDVKLGGRVLSHDDHDHEREDVLDEMISERAPRQGLLSPIISKSNLEEATMWLTGLKSLQQGKENISEGEERPLQTDTPEPIDSPG